VIRVVLADDQDLVRGGFRMILEAEVDMTVVGEAADGAEAVRVARRESPDVVLMDVQMPGMDGWEATRLIGAEAAQTRVVILTTFERDDYVFTAIRNGAAGFLLKNVPPEDLVAAVRTIARGDSLLSPSVTRRIVEEFARMAPVSPPKELERLTERELEVLIHVARGMTNAEIARDMFIGDATVKSHVSAILTKLGLRDRVQAVVYAYESGVIRPGG
jgi:DNA-binding NarL/FixJ family response regulator